MNLSSLNAEQATVFSSATFCRLWANIYGQYWHPLGARHDLGVVYSRTGRLRLRKYELAPQGLYWGSISKDIEAIKYFLDLATGLCNRWNCLRLDWNFRYDTQLAFDHAKARKIFTKSSISDTYTHVLDLDGDSYENVLRKKVKALTRRQIRLGLSAGLVVQEIDLQSDFDEHASMYKTWATEKKVRYKPPLLIPKLAKEMGNSTLFLGAFKQKKMLAAILVFRDQIEWFYWYGVRDMREDIYYSTDVLLSYAIQLACNNGARFFNMGGSNRIESLEFFKERWGAEKRKIQNISWENPFWRKILSLRKETMNYARRIRKLPNHRS